MRQEISGGTEYGVAFQVDDQSTDPSALITFEDYNVKTPYQVLARTAPVPAPDDTVETVVQEGAQRMLQPAAECLERDWEDVVTFFDFPQEHWVHIKTSNPIESIFAGVRLRTNATKRMRVREKALNVVFTLVCRPA
jgi:hypothetical protein